MRVVGGVATLQSSKMIVRLSRSEIDKQRGCGTDRLCSASVMGEEGANT